ncbi:hypothetical protein TRFO_34524 [Tritrichomonas foetus]|uniref:Uncharacterized protein n=1 Tax=Tritrichomonas foetus TaxID=1144522 RepID=A0A1J4JIZ4_9EUKA|nr:hypothetical protein TRFO_34524 [Tritrichomonas foetus]|eukprot:OHS99122.1 hypothetical protein TRFO_34524 [Tritrichomonas foetus]
MKKWERKFCFFQNDDTPTNQITSISVAKSGDQICAGTMSGQIYLFERRVDGSWDKTLTWIANKEIVDVRQQKAISGKVIDTDIFTIQRKCPLLISAGLREIRLWFISDRYEPVAPAGFVPKGIQFPPISSRERFVTANEISLIQSDSSFGSVRACQDGLSFAYTENTNVVIRRADHIEPYLIVFKNDSTLTRVDFHPTQFDILLTGDELGFCNFIDLRVQPTQSSATLRANSSKVLMDRHAYCADCRFSPDGSKFFTRHFGDILIWDQRNLADPLTHVKIPPDSGDIGKIISQDGKDFFRSTWIDNTAVATGWFGGEMYAISIKGKISKLFATKNSQKSGKKFFSSEKKKQWAKDHCVSSVDIAPGGTRAAASNGGDLFIYDLL